MEFNDCPRRSVSRFLVEQFQSQKESVNPQGPAALEKLHFKQEYTCVCDCMCIYVFVVVFIHVFE